MRKPCNTKDGKNEDACHRGRKKLEYKDQKKQTKLPLTGKLIYLDVKDVRLAKKLESDLKRLGSSVEKFFIKEINYLITSHPRPKTKNEDKIKSADSPAGVSTPSPFNCGPSPGLVETKAVPLVTRGKAILQKAQLHKKTSSIIENAEKWQVKIVSVEAALKWIQKELAKLPQTSDIPKNQSATSGSKIKRLRSPMLKFESDTYQYKPIHGNLVTWPYADVETPKGTCPFDGTTVGRGERSREERGDRIGLAPQMENCFPASPARLESGSNNTPRAEATGKSRPSENQIPVVNSVKVVTAGELRRRKEQKKMLERKRGYCECCQIKYEDLDKHVCEDQHRAFIRDKKNYETLDHLIQTGPSTAHFLQRILLKHCAKRRTADTRHSDSDEEVLLISPAKNSQVKMDKKSSQQSPKKSSVKIIGKGLLPQSPKKSAANTVDKRIIQKSPVKTPAASVQSKEEDNGTEAGEPCAKDVSQEFNVVTRQSCRFEAKKDNIGKVEETKTDLQGEITVEDNKDSISKDLLQNKISPAASLDADIHANKDISCVKSVDRSPEKQSYTSDGLDFKNHVVPVRAKNSLGMYSNMSPSRVSWARRPSTSPRGDNSTEAANKPGCVKILHTQYEGKENLPDQKTEKPQNISEDNNSSDYEAKRDSCLPGDRIRVLRESRSRSKVRFEESFPRETDRLHVESKQKCESGEEADDVQKPPGEVQFSPRRGRSCGSTKRNVDDKCDTVNNKEEMASVSRKEIITTRTKLRSPDRQSADTTNSMVDSSKLAQSSSQRSGSDVTQNITDAACLENGVKQDGALGLLGNHTMEQSAGVEHNRSVPESPRKRLRSRDSQISQDSPMLSGNRELKCLQDKTTGVVRKALENSVCDSKLVGQSTAKTGKSFTVDKKGQPTVVQPAESRKRQSVPDRQSCAKSVDQTKNNAKTGYSTSTDCNISAANSPAPDEYYNISSMEMVKKRSLLRIQAQKNQTSSPSSTCGLPTKLNRVTCKSITVSPIKSTKIALKYNNIAVKKSVKTDTSSNSSLGKVIQGKNRIEISTQKMKSITSTSTQLSASQIGTKKLETKLVRVSHRKTPQEEGKHRSRRLMGEIHGPSSDPEQSRISGRKAVPCEEENQNEQAGVSEYHRPCRLRTASKIIGEDITASQNVSPRHTERILGRSAASAKSARNLSCVDGKKSTVFDDDPYDIRNLSPLKTGQNIIVCPKSGYSGQTSRSRRKGKEWRQPRKSSSEFKSSNSRKLQKPKLPVPENTEASESCQPCDSGMAADTSRVDIPKIIDSNKDRSFKVSHRQPRSARQKLNLDSHIVSDSHCNASVDSCISPNCSPGLESSPMIKDNTHPKTNDSEQFIAIKKLEISDLTILGNEEEYLQKLEDIGSTKYCDRMKENPEKNRKRKVSHHDSGVGSSKEKSEKQSKERNSSTLSWHTTGVDTPKTKSVKLNKSWSLLSNRSMAKILQSEGDDLDFEGFQPEQLTGESLLGSEMSYVETTEVELEVNSDQEWLVEEEIEVDDTYSKYVNLTFTSPGKRTDSSWDDPFDNYIDGQVSRSKHGFGMASTSFNIAVHSSPRTFGSPRGRRLRIASSKRKTDSVVTDTEESDYMELVQTPKRRKVQKSVLGSSPNLVEQVDEDIEFNFGSPQKLREVVGMHKIIEDEVALSTSPLKPGCCIVTCSPREVVLSTSPRKPGGRIVTSTPHALRQTRKAPPARQKDIDIYLPALTSVSEQGGRGGSRRGQARTKSVTSQSTDVTNKDRDCETSTHLRSSSRHSVDTKPRR